MISPGKQEGAVTEVRGLVEKPKPEEAPSRLAVIGRYILQPDVMRILDKGETRRRRRNPADRRDGAIDRQAAVPRVQGRRRPPRLRRQGRLRDCQPRDRAGTRRYRAEVRDISTGRRLRRREPAPAVGELRPRSRDQRARISPSSIARVTTRASSAALSCCSLASACDRSISRPIRAISTSKWNGLAMTSRRPPDKRAPLRRCRTCR